MFSLTIRRKHPAVWTGMAAAILPAILAALFIRGVRISAQEFPAVIGRIEGDDLEVATATPAGRETHAGPTVVASGSDVTLRSGHALLLLNGGGEISVCGPAHFKLIKSASALTLALDYGRVHPSLESADGFTIYTPAIVATPIAIAGGPRDATLGLDQSGEMCVLTARGAMRVEPQLAGQSVIVPQGGTVSLAEGQIESLQADASACTCDFPRASLERSNPLPPPDSQTDRSLARLARPLPPERRKTENAPPPSSSAEEPVYTVLMPPLSFNATSPEPPPDPDPETILLVREVRLRPSVVFRGHVNEAPAPVTADSPPVAALAPPAARPPEPKSGFFDRVRAFFRGLIG